MFAINTIKKGVLLTVSYQQTECIDIKSGCVKRVTKHLKVDWLIVLQ